jgi:predicted ATPase
MREGVAAIRALASEDFRTYFLSLLAATLAKAGETAAALDVIGEALDAVERSGERFYAAELHRQKGELLLATGHDLAGVAGCLETAVEIARQQRASALERRARQALDSVLSRTT